MNHPPIPPNCSYFFQSVFDNKWHFLPTRSLGNGSANLEGNKITWGLDGSFEWMRPIIAAVARCAWLDEFHRLLNMDAELMEHAVKGDEGDRVKYEQHCDAGDAAQANAEAWRKWGQQK